jgi:hypothetical protein
MKMVNERLYQDVWIKGRLKSRGVRDCESGYTILKNIAQRFNRPFTMLDIGANYGYFSTRLAEDFDCCCVAVEPECDFAQRFFEENDNHKVILLKHEFTPKSIYKLAQAEHFDIVLAYGVIHWLPMSPIDSLHALTDLGDMALIELPFEEDGKTVGRDKMKQYNQHPFDYPVVGHMKSHLVMGRRKVILAEERKVVITRKHVLNDTPISLQVQSDYNHKFARHAGQSIPWVNGINLMTLIAHDCRYPSFAHLKECLVNMEAPAHHGDIRPWNIVFDGQRCTLIDGKDAWPTSNDKRDLQYLLDCNSYKDLLALRTNDTKMYRAETMP